MKYIKLFEGFQSESEVAEICEKYDIRYWSINSEGLVDVDGDVTLLRCGLTKIPLKFGTVTGSFDCDENQLTSLEGCPHTVNNFYCMINQLTSLEGCPKEVGDDFYCSNNQIISFDGVKKIGGDFNCCGNPIGSIWDLIYDKRVTPYGDVGNYKWDNQVMELFNDYDCIRGGDIILDRFNDFLIEIGKPTVDEVKGYNRL